MKGNFLFFLGRPHYFPEAMRRIRRRIGLNLLPRPLGKDRGPAERWAAARAVTSDDAIRTVTGSSSTPVETLFPEVWEDAIRRAKQSPVKMGGAGLTNLLYHVAVHLKANRIVETGVAYGYSSLALLLAVREADGSLISVDMPYPGRGNAQYVGCAVPEDLRRRWTILRYPDSIGLPRALKGMEGQIDLFHYDSDKQYEGRAWAYPLAWRYLRAGGLLVSDDINDNTAFRDFAEHINVDPIVVRGAGPGGAGDRFVGILRKP